MRAAGQPLPALWRGEGWSVGVTRAEHPFGCHVGEQTATECVASLSAIPDIRWDPLT